MECGYLYGWINSLCPIIPDQGCVSHNSSVPAFQIRNWKFRHFCIDGIAPRWSSELIIALLAYFSGKSNQSEQFSSFCVCLKPGLTWPSAAHYRHVVWLRQYKNVYISNFRSGMLVRNRCVMLQYFEHWETFPISLWFLEYSSKMGMCVFWELKIWILSNHLL